MRRKEELKKLAVQAIEKRWDEVMALGDSIYYEPELGYKEVKTAKKFVDALASLGISSEEGLAVTGVKAVIKGASPGPTVAVLGELDSVISPQHPDADKQTGAAHCCGHNSMMAALFATAAALVDTDIMDDLSGNVALIAAPAEEFVELAFRKELIEKGTIDFIGGKQQLIKEGVFDDVDIALLQHPYGNPDPQHPIIAIAGESWNGFLGQEVTFIGRESHAGMAPQDGVNALSAARVAFCAIDAQRETFIERDSVRVHPIITKGGDLVNVIPGEVKVETQIRGSNVESILDTTLRVTRSWKAGADALGAEVEISTLPGYLPFSSNEPLVDITYKNMQDLFGEEKVRKYGPHGTASSDIGDVAALLPTIQFRLASANDKFHSSEFRLLDKKRAYLDVAKVFVMNIIDLLYEEAKEAKDIVEAFTPLYTKETYLAQWGKIGETFR